VHLGTTAVVRLEGALAHDGSLSGRTGSAGAAHQVGGRPDGGVGTGPGADTDVLQGTDPLYEGQTPGAGHAGEGTPALRTSSAECLAERSRVLLASPPSAFPTAGRQGNGVRVDRLAHRLPGVPSSSPQVVDSSVDISLRQRQGRSGRRTGRPPRKPSRAAGPPRAEG
jgi:hypothetical protein